MTISTNNYQIGQSAVPNQNFHLTTPAIPDGSLQLYRGNVGAPSGAAILSVSATGDVTITGRVSTPNRPAFMAYGCNAAASGTGLTWSNEAIDVGGNFNPTTGLFTAPIAGVYYFEATAMGASGLAGEVRLALYRNGVVEAGTNNIILKGAGALLSARTSGHLNLAAGQTVQVFNTQSPEPLFAADVLFSHFSGHLVS